MVREIPGMWEYLNGDSVTGRDREPPQRGAARMPGDNGCRYSPSCLSCHLPKCYWEMARTEQRRWDHAWKVGKTPEMTRMLYAWGEATGILRRQGYTVEDVLREIDRVIATLDNEPGEERP